MENFYSLESNDFNTETGYADTDYYSIVSSRFGNALRCSVCKDFVTSQEWLPPYKIKLVMRTKQYGNILSNIDWDIVVDKYFRECFEKTQLTGLTFLDEAVITTILCYNGVRKKHLATPPKYYVARVKYGGAAIDHKKSDSIFRENRVPVCDYCRVGFIDYYARLAIDETTWDGTDIFLARGWGAQVTVSQRFKEWWDSCHFNNCRLIPAEECHGDWR